MLYKFIATFEIFLCATGLEEEPEKRQVMCLLNVICARSCTVYVQSVAIQHGW